MIRRRRRCRWRRAASPSSCTPRPRPYPLPGSRPAAHQARSCLEPRPGPPRPWPPRRSYGTRLASESRTPPLRRRRRRRLLLLLLLHHHPLRPHCLHRPLLHRHLRHHLRRRRLLRRARPSDQDAATEIRTTVTPGLPASRLASASGRPMRRAGGISGHGRQGQRRPQGRQGRQGPQGGQGPQPEALGSSPCLFSAAFVAPAQSAWPSPPGTSGGASRRNTAARSCTRLASTARRSPRS
jgi:hypothetical protein